MGIFSHVSLKGYLLKNSLTICGYIRSWNCLF